MSDNSEDDSFEEFDETAFIIKKEIDAIFNRALDIQAKQPLSKYFLNILRL